MITAQFDHVGSIERTRIEATPARELRLHRLERPVAWGRVLLEEMEAVPPSNFYPDYTAFYEELEAFFGIPAHRIVVGQGIEGLIRDLFMLCCSKGDKVAFTAPTCAMFDIYARVFGADVRHIVLLPSMDARTAAQTVLDKLPGHLKLLILPNPGQPVDVAIGIKDLRRIAAHCASMGAVFAIDEAYHGFGAETALELVDEFDNVVVLRTFSKAFGAAAIRVGFAVSQSTMIRALRGVRQSGEVSGPSIHAASVLMKRYYTNVLPGISQIVDGRNWLRDAVKAAGFVARGENANHVLIDMAHKDSARDVVAELRKRGIRVRSGYDWPLHRHILVTAGPVGLMQYFYEQFQQCVAKVDA